MMSSAAGLNMSNYKTEEQDIAQNFNISSNLPKAVVGVLK